MEQNGFPNPFGKKDKDFILKYSETLWRDAINRRGTYNFEENRDRYVNNRKYSEGLHSVEKFKSQFSQTGDYTYMNLDWGVATPLPKFSEIIRGQMINQPLKLNLTPIDSMSTTELDSKRNLIYAKMIAKRELGELEKVGIEIAEAGIPKNEDEFEIFVNSNFKLSQTIALESITKAVMEDNDMNFINKKIAKDLVDNKIAAVRITLDENKFPKIEYIDPERIVTSYVKRDDFADSKHIGVLTDVLFEDLRVQSGLSDEELYDIAKNVAGKYSNPAWGFGDARYYNQSLEPFNRWTVRVLDYEFFSTDEKLFQKMEAKNGGFYFQEKPEGFEPPKNPKRKRELFNRKVKNVYCAKYIVGTKYIYDYGKKEFIIRKRINGKYSTNTTLGFVVYAPDIFEMQNKSLVEQMIPYADEMIRIQLKIQQFISKAKPPGLIINMDAFVAALAGMGLGGLKPLDARAITDQIGDIYYKAFREDGSPATGNRPPVEPSPSGIDASIGILVNLYNDCLNRMKETIGMNDAVDGSQPSSKSLVGVQKMSLLAHKNALRVLYEGYVYINEEVARQVCLLSQQLIRYGYHKETFRNMIGDANIKEIDFNKLGIADYAINVSMLPDEGEKEVAEGFIRLGIERDRITTEDALEARELLKEDVQKAMKFLAVRERIRMEQKAQQAEQNSKVQAEIQAQAAQLAEQAKQQTEQAKIQMEMEKLQLEYQLKTQFEKDKEEEKRKTEALKAEFELEKVRLASQLAAQNKGGTLEDTSFPKELGKIEPNVMPTVVREAQ